MTTLTETRHKPTTTTAPTRVIRDEGFARRLESACEGHAHAPAPHHGRLPWLQKELVKLGEPVSIETCRKWFAGETRPRPDKAAKIAQILQVDVAWLSLGIAPDLTLRQQKVRNATADGAVNVVAGLIQMDGGYPAFPEEGDKRAQRDLVDLYAIIKGANYAFHVAMGEADGDKIRFAVPTRHDTVVMLGLIRVGFTFYVYEIPSELIDEIGVNRGGSINLTISPSELREITGFTERL